METKKRRRVAIVCLVCRRKKLKCDRRKPLCQNCVNSGSTCEYATPHWAAEQEAKGPSVATTEKGVDETNEAILSPQSISKKSFDDETEIERLKVELKRLKRKLQVQKTSQSNHIEELPSDSIGINFYDSYNSLTIKKSFCNDKKPFSDGATIFKDVYLRCSLFGTFLSFVPEKYTYLSLLESNELYIPVSINKSDQEWVNIIQEFTKEREEIAEFKELFLPSVFGAINEDDSYQELIKLIEDILPDKNIYHFYVDYFVNNVQAYYPMVNTDFFQKLQAGPLKEFPNSNRFSVEPGSNWRHFAWLATLLVVLRMTYFACQRDIRKSNKEEEFIKANPISIDLVALAGKCLGHVNIFKKFNEDLLECLICIRTYIFVVDEMEMISTTSTDIITDLIIYCSLNMGLHRDPTEFIQYANNPELITLRRRLWVLIIMISRMDVSLLGKVSALRRDFIMKIDTSNFDPSDISPGTFLVKQTIGMKLLSKFDGLVLNVHSKTKLGDIRNMIDQVTSTFEEYFAVDYMEEHKDDARAIARNMSIFNMNLQYSVNVVIVIAALYSHFDNEAYKDPLLFKEFFLKTMDFTFKISKNVINCLNGTNDKYMDSRVYFVELAMVQQAWLKCSYLILSAVLRCHHTIKRLNELKLKKTGYKRALEEIEAKLNALDQISNVLFSTLQRLLVLAKEKISLKLFSCLKDVLWIDYMVKSIKENGRDQMVYTLETLKADTLHHKKFRKTILKSTGYNIENLGIEDLDRSNQLMLFDEKDLSQFLTIVKSGTNQRSQKHRSSNTRPSHASKFNNQAAEDRQDLNFLNTKDTYNWLDPAARTPGV